MRSNIPTLFASISRSLRTRNARFSDFFLGGGPAGSKAWGGGAFRIETGDRNSSVLAVEPSSSVPATPANHCEGSSLARWTESGSKSSSSWYESNDCADPFVGYESVAISTSSSLPLPPPSIPAIVATLLVQEDEPMVPQTDAWLRRNALGGLVALGLLMIPLRYDLTPLILRRCSSCARSTSRERQILLLDFSARCMMLPLVVYRVQLS